jgi:hypothetical protein
VMSNCLVEQTSSGLGQVCAAAGQRLFMVNQCILNWFTAIAAASEHSH